MVEDRIGNQYYSVAALMRSVERGNDNGLRGFGRLHHNSEIDSAASWVVDTVDRDAVWAARVVIRTAG
jgi:hypothetical protein